MREFKTHAHPLTDQSFDLVNTVNRKVAEKCVHIVGAVSIGEQMALAFVISLSDGFHDRQDHGNNETGSGRRRKGSARPGGAVPPAVDCRTESIINLATYSNIGCVQCIHLSLTSVLSFAKGVGLSL